MPTEQSAQGASFGKRFIEGLSLQLTNPKAIFFLSMFPQFINPEKNYALQFAAVALTYGSPVVAIHCIHALFARHVKSWLTSERGGRAARRTAGTTFVMFGAVLAAAKR